MRVPRIWPGNTKAVSPGCLGVTAWRRRCGLHRRTTGGWSQTGRELGIGDVVIAESGDMSALYVGCRSATLHAELSPSAPADSACDRLDAVSMARAIGRDARNRWRGRHERARRELEFRHAESSGDWAAGLQDMHQPLLSHVQAGDGRPCTQAEQRSSSNPRGVSQSHANTFCQCGRCSIARYHSLRIAPTKPLSRLATAARDPASCR